MLTSCLVATEDLRERTHSAYDSPSDVPATQRFVAEHDHEHGR